MILNRQRAVRVGRPALETFLLRVEKEFGLDPEGVTICLVSDAEIARMNETFRAKKGPTDVLSFPARASGKAAANPSGKFGARHRRERVVEPRKGPQYIGDIAISPSTARRNARAYGRTLSSELRILILHGLLHLQGYDHETDRGQMNRVEQRLRRKFGLA
jgi:probable rRNA maturation factor